MYHLNYQDILLQERTRDIDGDFAHQIHIAYLNGNENLTDNAGNQIGGRTVQAGVVTCPPWSADHIEQKRFKQQEDHFGEAFHNYTMIWKPDSITYMVDDQFYGTIKDKSVLDQLNNKKVCY